MAVIIDVGDLPTDVRSHELAQRMVDGANAKASRVAPCLASSDPEPTADQLDEARLVLIGAVKRWAEASSGALSAQVAGPFSQTVDTRQRTGYNLWPSEIKQLQDICSTGETSGAFTVDSISTAVVHADTCSINFGATYCSCGAALTGLFPLYEGD